MKFKTKKKAIYLVMTLVFLLTAIMPTAGFAADNDYTKYSSTYNYVTADDEVNIGTATVKSKAYGGDLDQIQVKLVLPDGVTFTDDPTSADVAADKFVQVDSLDAFSYIKSDSSSIVLKDLAVANAWQAEDDSTIKFDFSKIKVDISSDFTGNLDATLSVWGIKDGSIAWSESDTVTLAKVAGSGDVLVSAKDPKTVSEGSNQEAAQVKIYETEPGKLATEKVYFDILTDGVTFNKVDYKAASFKGKVGDAAGITSGTVAAFTEDDTRYTFEPKEKATIFPGDATFTPYLDIDPDVTGDIKIRVTSADDTLTKTTVVVATVGDAQIKIDKLEDNDTVAYSGQVTELDASMKLVTTDDSDFAKGDMIKFTLNNGKFTEDPVADDADVTIKRYNDDKSFYASFDNPVSEFTLDTFKIKLDNDTEPGDITLTIGGDYGDLDAATIGTAAAPVTLTAEKTPIMNEALNQAAGDITITETSDGALKDGGVLVLELPSGLELNGKPKMDVVSGNYDADLSVLDNKYITLQTTTESSDPSEIKIYNISYDTGKLALNGDVNIKAYFIDPDVLKYDDSDLVDGDINTVQKMIDNYDDSGVISTVANATVGAENQVNATFKVGDEGVAVLNGRTLVQVNQLCDALGMQKSYDEATKTAYFVLNGKVVSFTMGENAIGINGTKIAVDQGGKIINNYTYATLRGIQMAFGGDLTWDDTTKTATFVFNK